eukprot:gene18615-3214_t
MLAPLHLAVLVVAVTKVAPLQGRDVVVADGMFTNSSTGKRVVLTGTNVVLKGWPWLPTTDGDTFCDTPANPSHNTSCRTFNAADAMHLKTTLGYNFIRLGVTWAGAQPTSGAGLDPAWVRRLQAILTLCHDNGIAVLLDVHQDAVGTAVCGEGVPQWYSAIATPHEIGKPLTPVTKLKDGTCGEDDKKSWALYKGDPQYNIKNPCCALITTVQAQATLFHLFSPAGRVYYAKYMELLAAAVVDYPAAGVSKDLAVGVMDTGQTPLPYGDIGLSKSTLKWLQSASHLFYAFHWYGEPKPVSAAIKNAVTLATRWRMPALLTEYGGYGSGCTVQAAAAAVHVGTSYWHYSDYCWPKH